MNLRYKKAFVFVLAGISYCAGFFFSNPARFGFCLGPQSGSYICRVPGAVTIGWPLIFLGQMLAIIAIILLFANADTFRKWLKFSVFYIPIVILLDYLIYPIGFSPGFAQSTYEQGMYPFGWLYVLISLAIVLISWLRNRK